MAISNMMDRLLGMILGMIASPLITKLIKSIQQSRKVNKLLKEAADDLQKEKKTMILILKNTKRL